MIYDILDFLEELFWKVRAYYRKRKSIVIGIFIFIISIYAGSLIFFLKDERIRLVKENRKYDFWYVQKFDFKTKLYVMNYGFSLNDIRLYNFNFKRHLIGWKWKIGSKDVFYVFILPYNNRKQIYFPERQILYLKKVDYSKEFEKEAIDYKNIGEFLEVKLVEDEKDRKIRKFLKFLEENN